MTKKITIITAVSIIIMLTMVLVGNAEVGNNSFETPVVKTSQKWDIFDSGTPGLEWEVEWYGGATSYKGVPRPEVAKLEFHRGVLGNAQDGAQYIELDTDWEGPGGSLNNEPASVKITQEVELIAGCSYSLNYYWSPRPKHGDNKMNVYIDDSVVNSHSGSGGSSPIWNYEQVAFEASENLVEIGFAETGTADSLGMFLDNVSVEITESDTDGDGIYDCVDNCLEDYNPNQEDSDGDGIGDACELSICSVTGEDTAEDSGYTRLGVNRWVLKWNAQEGEFLWETKNPNGKGPRKEFTLEQTQGCSCEQILTWLHENYPEEYGEMKGHWKFGCSISVIEEFIEKF